MILPALLLFAQAITYTKSFPGSVPAYVKIEVPEAGNATYNDDPKGDTPAITFAVTPQDRANLKDLTSKLSNFNKSVESPAKVAFMGMKTFRFENGSDQHEMKFNYSEDPDARALADWFDRIIQTEQERLDLETRARFDKLGVDQALIRVEVSWDAKRLVAPEQFLPILDRITKNETYMHMARARAAGLAEHIRGTVK